MADVTQLEWIAGTLAVAAFAVAYGWWIRHGLTERLMRCPETGGVALVNVEPAPAAQGSSIALQVRKCDLWRVKRGCAQGCLARYSETSPGHRVALHALRPFEYR